MIRWNTVNTKLAVNLQYMLVSKCFYFHRKTIIVLLHAKESTNSKGLIPLPRHGIFILANRSQP